MADLLYQELTYKIRGAIFDVHKALGSGHKESVYHKALAEEFKKQAVTFLVNFGTRKAEVRRK